MAVTVFIPDTATKPECTGYIYGRIQQEVHSGCEMETSVIIQSIKEEYLEQKDHSYRCIGFATEQSECPTFSMSRFESWLDIKSGQDLNLKYVKIYNKTVSPCDVKIIIYKLEDFRKSAYFEKILAHNFSHVSFIESLISDNIVNNYDSNPQSNLRNIFIRILYLIFIFMQTIKNISVMFNSALAYLPCHPSVFLKQINHRCTQVEEIYKLFTNKQNILLKVRLAGILVCDIILGCFCMYVASTFTTTEQLHYQFYVGTEAIANTTKSLLEWLKGAPAGLKLNQPLTQALSSLFLYHVYLWTVYLELAAPLFLMLSSLFVYSGLLGVSIMAAMLVDVLNIAALHVYFFYIYAARIHMVQISLLKFTWRAFRGKKWNPLKQRVDSIDTERLKPLTRVLIGLLFTLAVFLLPTTTVYYVVFVTLRLLLLCINGVVSSVIWMLNVNPVFLFCLYITNSSVIKGEVCIDQLSCDSSGSLQISLSCLPSSFPKTLAITASPAIPQPPSIPPNIIQILIQAQVLL